MKRASHHASLDASRRLEREEAKLESYQQKRMARWSNDSHEETEFVVRVCEE